MMSWLSVLRCRSWAWVFAALTCVAASAAAQTTLNPGLPSPAPSTSRTEDASDPNAGQPIRLRRPQGTQPTTPADDRPARGRPQRPEAELDEPVYVPGEFERFVQQLIGGIKVPQIRRFGADLVTAMGDRPAAAMEESPLVPDDYIVGPGDEVLITLWGSVDAELRLPVDRAGRISIPRVGTVQVAGLRADELQDVVHRRVAQVFRNFQSSVSMGALRGIRIFVTGFVVRPGTYTVSSLSSVVAALMRAGGPSAAGSFRNVELRRGAQVVAQFDLYDLLLKGDRSADRTVRSGDVVHVGAVGTQVGFIGSVNKQAIFELKTGETVSDALRMAGGFTAVADRSRLAIERLKERSAGRVAELQLPRDATTSMADGDVLRAFSAVDAALPSQQQSKRVKVEGEVVHPAEYVLPAGSSLSDAIRAAGGYTPAAFLYAAELTRESVQRTQQENYDRALRDLETDIARASGTQRVATAEEASAQTARATATDRLVERLRALRPSGRIVLQIPPDAAELPDLALEDGDRIHIPPRPTTVGVFGSVFNGATYLHLPGRSVGDYLRLAGGPTKGADEGSIFVVRANGNVISGRQDRGWFGRTGNVSELPSEPGDTVFVPEEMDKTTFLQAAKDWTQIIFNFGLGMAGIVSATR
ncbi:MAG: SLBB domain-containing protein [Betaproteobacteria bacterium]|nr:SLBB domain-containing protein [Betaproteobacteria bacterium]MCC6250061.1 SLBB domain-containing protein [Rubrivivax sp.]MCL4695574.1 polysaccharide export protein [Burkholderiaceae bacterium]